jgi:mRNA-degrading endonuclease RelE of RelBE toxin-antitoxin system
MPFQLTITDVAEAHLHHLSARDRKTVVAGIMARLPDEPTKTSKSLKKLRPNPFAEYELRIEQHRVLYNVVEGGNEVIIRAVGEKVGNKLIVAGEEFHEHDSDPPA